MPCMMFIQWVGWGIWVSAWQEVQQYKKEHWAMKPLHEFLDRAVHPGDESDPDAADHDYREEFPGVTSHLEWADIETHLLRPI